MPNQNSIPLNAQKRSSDDLSLQTNATVQSSNLSVKSSETDQMQSLADSIKQWGLELGFADIGITDTDLSAYEADYFNWLGENYHGDMGYMEKHGTKRTRPNELEPGTQSIISVRLNYLDLGSESALAQLHQPQQAYISRYALGKDYHKLLRKRLQALAEKIALEVEGFQYRAFTDSAPVLERPIAEKSGIGFTGKNSLVIHPRAGSWFFLGELYTNLKLPIDAPFTKQGCGPCTACIKECPTQAIIDNAIVDARRCISYLTIEFQGSIAKELRPLMGNRIYGCDDCQLVCPWNKFTESTQEPAFSAKNRLDNQSLFDLWQWSENDFLKKLEGSPIRRIGYAQWTRNLSIALGNITGFDKQTEQLNDKIDLLNQVILRLKDKLNQISPLVDEHIEWAIDQQESRLKETELNTTNLESNHSEKVIEATELTARQLKQANLIKPFKAPKYYLPTAKP